METGNEYAAYYEDRAHLVDHQQKQNHPGVSGDV